MSLLKVHYLRSFAGRPTGRQCAPVRNVVVVLEDGALLPFLSGATRTVGRSATATRELIVASFEAPPEDALSAAIQVIDGPTEQRLFTQAVTL